MRPKSQHVRFNAVKNTLYLPIGNPLPCLRKCPFFQLCDLHHAIFADSNINYAGPCPIESSLYLELQNLIYLNPDFRNISPQLIEEYICLHIALERIRKHLCLEPDMTNERNQLSKGYEVLARLQKKYLRVTEKIMTIMHNDNADRSN